MKAFWFVFLVSVCLPLSGRATPSQPLIDLAAEQLAADYMKKSTDSKGIFHRSFPGGKDWRCEDPPSSSECVDFVCDRLGRFGCDTTEEIKRVSKACLGNYNERCLANVCDKLGRFGCDSIEEVEDIAPSCKGVWSTKCIDVVCSKLGRFGCDQSEELKQVSRTCRGVESSCIDSLCSRLDRFECDSIEEIREVAQACRGED